MYAAVTGRYAAVTGRYAAWRPTHDEIHDVCRYVALPHCGRAKLFSEAQLESLIYRRTRYKHVTRKRCVC